MSERKVLSKYYPPDFNPSLLPRRPRTQHAANSPPKLPTVRLGAPFSMKCTSCGEYIYKGRRFNARKEVAGEKYLGLTIYRFYIRCTRCSGEIAFKTDPQNMDYVVEWGARRNFEGWRGGEGEEGGMEQEDDVMERLEAKVAEEETNMAVADALDEIRRRNDRRECRVAEMVSWSRLESKLDGDAEDAELARLAFASKRKYVGEELEVIEEVVEEVEEEEKDGVVQVGEWQNVGSRKRKRSERPSLVKRVKR